MGLNKAKGRMFKSVGWTWNPIAGGTHDCAYCWAKALRARWGKGFEPEIRRKYWNDKMPGDGSWIFVGSMGDVFCDGIPKEWILELLDYIKNCEADNKFLLQTKNPPRFHERDIYASLKEVQNKVIVGTTIETTDETRTWSKAPPTYLRFYDLHTMKLAGFKTFLSLEPLADFRITTMKEWIMRIQPEAVELGLENYSHHLPRPSNEKIIKLVKWLNKKGITYVLKENLDWVSQEINGGIK